jgi:hypothetical protein
MKIDISKTSRLFIEHDRDVEQILMKAVRQALLEHKRAGNPVAIWRDGAIVILQPDEIVIDNEPEE